jgi:hypothetical protein
MIEAEYVMWRGDEHIGRGLNIGAEYVGRGVEDGG